MSTLLQNINNNIKNITFSDADHAMWQKIYKKQINRLQDLATPFFLNNLKKFDLSIDRIPSIDEISNRMFASTGWRAEPVDGLVDYTKYFSLLKERLFPIAMFIRQNDEENLSKDPDIFHEVFGHCTMLLSHDYADFLQEYARFALTVAMIDRPLFARLIWFTTETGLISTNDKLKIYGSSIISSYTESFYAINSNIPVRKPFNIVNIFREPYRADILQRVYYVIDDPSQVYNLVNNTDKLYQALNTARHLGEFPALFVKSNDKYANIAHCYPISDEVT